MGLFDKINVGSVLGGVGGFMLGGPWGAAAGASLGNALVGSTQNRGGAPGAAAAPYNPVGTPVGGGKLPAIPSQGGETWRQPMNQYDQATGMPLIAPYASARDSSGNLMSPYQMKVGELGDASAWGKLMGDKVALQTTKAVDDINAKSASGTASAWSDLAMNGGLSSGARERIAQAGNRDALFAAQDARNQGDLNQLEVGLQTENMNRDAQKFNIGNQMNASQFNAGAALDDLKGFNTQNMLSYQERMKDFTGSKMAQAMAAANGQQSGWGKLMSDLTFGLL